MGKVALRSKFKDRTYLISASEEGIGDRCQLLGSSASRWGWGVNEGTGEGPDGRSTMLGAGGPFACASKRTEGPWSLPRRQGSLDLSEPQFSHR